MDRYGDIVIEKRAFEAIRTLAGYIETELCKDAGNLDEWVTTNEACKVTKLRPSAIRYYRVSGKISFSRLGGKYYYKKCDLDKLD